MTEKGYYPVGAIASILDLDARRVQQLAKQGVIPKGRRGQYHLVESVRGYIRFLRTHDDGTAVDGKVDIAKLRKVSVETELLEMERDVQRGRLIDIGRYERGLMLAFGRVRERLVALAPRLAPHLLRLESEAAAEAMVDRYVLEAIAELRADEVPDDEEPVAVAAAA